MTALLLGAVLVLVPRAGDASVDARAVTILTATHPRTITLEWRRIERGATVSLAERPVVLAGRTEVPVGGDEQVLRVREPGAAPRTFVVPAGRDSASFDLGPPARGGEVFGRLAPRRYRPEALRLRGAGGRAEARPDERGVFAVAGLAAGRYEVEPVYRGGMVGRKAAVTVEDGRTSELLPLEVPATGAVRAVLAASLCGERELELRLEAPGRPAHRLAIEQGVCTLEVEGLEPGTWRAAVTRGGARNELRAQAEFVVAADEEAGAELMPVVRVTGTVTAAGAPAAGQRIVFQQAADRWNTMTDALGAYDVLLGRPGEYAVSVMAAKDLPSRSFVRTFVPGDQQEDIELGPGTIEVWIRAEPGFVLDGAVELALFEAQGQRLAGRFEIGENPAIFTGLEYGQYTVTGTAASGLRSRNEVRVDLSADSPSARVDLLMARGKGLLRVVGEDGVPLEGARASAGDSPLPEREPGVFDISGVPAGERLVAQATDHVPVCRLLGGDLSSPVVALPAADSVFTLRLRADAPWQGLLLMGVQGSDCPVGVHEFGAQVSVEQYAMSLTLRLPRGSFGIALEGQIHTATAPGDLEIP